MKGVYAVFLGALVLAGCGGGGGGAIPHSAPNPGSTATAAPQGNHLAAAPATVYTATGPQSISKRKAQSVNLGSGGIPTVVGATSPYFGSILTEILAWADNGQNAPVPESSMSAVPANAVSGPVSVASIGQDNGNEFAATYFDWVIQLQINKVGSGNIVVHFGDGTTGSIPVYIYDQWYLTCGSVSGPTIPVSWAYKNGVPTGNAYPAVDMSVDCTGLNISFPNGAVNTTPAVADAWGNVASAFTAVTSGTTNASALTIPVSSLVIGGVYIVALSDGGYAKVMPLISDGSALAPNISGISLHDNPSGSGQFAF